MKVARKMSGSFCARPFFPLVILLLLASVALPVHAASYGPTKPGDDLWDIVKRVHPAEDISRDQAMLAVLKANPHAFSVSCNAASYLKLGVTLQIPSPAEMQALGRADAERELARHEEQWASHRATGEAIACPSLPEDTAAVAAAPESATAPEVATAPKAAAAPEAVAAPEVATAPATPAPEGVTGDVAGAAKQGQRASTGLDPVILSRIQFAFVISFHIIFPAFTIGLAAWLATIEGARLATGNPVYRRVFDFWLKVFAVSFGMGVVTGIVMAFQFGTNWGVLAQKSGSIQGPLLGYEAFTAFLLEATFFGVMLLGRERVSPRFYFFACAMVSLGTMFSSFWILANNSWMQVPLGHTIVDGKIIPDDWWAIVTGPVMMVRWPHMLLAAFLTTGMCVAATGAWYVLRGIHRAEARVMLHWGLGLVAVLIPIQLFFGHLTGLYLYEHQPAKLAAIEARWEPQQPGTEVWFAWPDEKEMRNRFAIQTPGIGSLIDTGDWDAPMQGLTDFPEEDRPPVLIPFFGFRIMVGMGLIMLAVSWWGNFLRFRGRLEKTRWFLWGTFLAFPTGFIAVLSGWYTAEPRKNPQSQTRRMRTLRKRNSKATPRKMRPKSSSSTGI